MNDIITNEIERFLRTVKKKMESDDPVAQKYADQFYLNLQKTPDIVKKQMSFHMMHEIWTCMVYPLLEDAVSSWKLARTANTSSLSRIEELEQTIFDLQMADSHLEFISRIQDVGMHHDWDEFMDTLIHAEENLNKAGSVPKDYESVELDFEPDEPSEFGIFYKGGQLSMDEIILRLNRLSEIESKLR